MFVGRRALAVSRRFMRRVEDFRCARCGLLVEGDGYTNHCPRCLWSRHVDVHPGDRAAGCGGLMEPLAVVVTGSGPEVVHRCARCGLTRNNQLGKAVDEALVRELAARPLPAARRKRSRQ
jgi:DNA-directed RNA polymerase subunit RPC12/RpoP